MSEDYYKSPVLRNRLRRGLAAPFIDEFVAQMLTQGYTRLSIEGRLLALASWTDWMEQRELKIGQSVEGLTTCRHELETKGRVRGSRSPNKNALLAAKMFIRFLQQKGLLARSNPKLLSRDKYILLRSFHSWMKDNRGLKESTLEVYEYILVELLDELGESPEMYSAAQIRKFILDRAAPHGIQRAKTIATAVRAFLRFLGATGHCRSGLEGAVPSFASWRLSSTPRYLEPHLVEELLAACQVERKNGLRERAVLLLLARLGLRASEVSELRLRDFDWHNGRFSTCGKGRRKEWLPLPQEVGDAILAYIENERPSLKSDHVFTKLTAPLGPLSRASVTHIVREALCRAGIKGPHKGAHMLRHSAATAMLRQGADLTSIGAVLRHRSPSTTAHYAKVHFKLLDTVTQQWPEVTS